MDWIGCNLIEQVPGKVGGRPVIRGTRIEPDVILVDEEYGRTPERTDQSFPTIPGGVNTIKKLRAFIQNSWRKLLLVTGCGRLKVEAIMDWNDCELVERIPGKQGGGFRSSKAHVFPLIRS